MRVLTCLLLLLTMSPAQAQEPSEEDELVWDAYHLAVAEAGGDIHGDLLIAKRMRFLQNIPENATDSDQRRALRARADVVKAELEARVDAARDRDPVLLAGDLGCWPDAKSEVCSERRRKLEAFAPDNAYLGMLLMTHAWMAEDHEAYLRAARLAASAERYDSQFANAFGVLRERYRAVPYPTLANEPGASSRLTPEVMAMAVAAGLVMPPFQPFSEPCRASEGELRDHCLAVAKKMMAQGQNLLEIYIAQSVVEALGSESDIREAKALRRELDWLLARSFPLGAAMEQVEVAGTREYFDAFAAHGEIEAMRALLAAHAIPLTPPEGWTKE